MCSFGSVTARCGEKRIVLGSSASALVRAQSQRPADGSAPLRFWHASHSADKLSPYIIIAHQYAISALAHAAWTLLESLSELAAARPRPTTVDSHRTSVCHESDAHSSACSRRAFALFVHFAAPCPMLTCCSSKSPYLTFMFSCFIAGGARLKCWPEEREQARCVSRAHQPSALQETGVSPFVMSAVALTVQICTPRSLSLA